ncbi:MAG TPA: hypothetical protein VFB21_04280 [Chthonomonadaceae bacterium]|nr:hypothetical protein [Chthonomonadaceae bacterium]
MAVKSEKPSFGKQKAGLPAIIIGAVVLIAFLVWMGYRAFGPEPKPPPTEAAKAYDAWWDKIAKESGGDISKLSQEDMRKLQATTYGHGEQALKAYAQEHGYTK